MRPALWSKERVIGTVNSVVVIQSGEGHLWLVVCESLFFFFFFFFLLGLSIQYVYGVKWIKYSAIHRAEEL